MQESGRSQSHHASQARSRSAARQRQSFWTAVAWLLRFAALLVAPVMFDVKFVLWSPFLFLRLMAIDVKTEVQAGADRQGRTRFHAIPVHRFG